METVPSLCASGTLGVAAVGLALGYPRHSSPVRPVSKKKRRRMPSRMSLRDNRSMQEMPITPARPPQTSSAPTSKLQKRASAGRPLTSSSNPGGGTRTLGSTPDSKLNYGFDNGTEGNLSLQRSEQPLEHGTFTFESKGSENRPPSWLRPMSTLSSLKNGNIEPTSFSDSPSASYSNGSAAPILPDFTELSPTMSSRNKLVKRSSSQRLLYSGNKSHTNLRRPATSHQRSATLQQHFQQDAESGRPSLAASSIFPREVVGEEERMDKDSQVWLPSFKAQSVRSAGNITSRKRSANNALYRNDSIRTIVPDMTEVATLLMATSLSSESSDEKLNGRDSNLSRLSRPFTSAGFETPMSTGADNTTGENDGADAKPRNSFSLSEMFPSPSPSTWKMPRTGSLKKTRPFVRNPGGRRVVSAPQHRGQSETTHLGQAQHEIDKANVMDVNAEKLPDLSDKQRGPSRGQHRGSSSPLPPLNRLSSFEISLPGNIPSYPTSPRQENLTPSPQDPSAPSSRWVSSSFGTSASKLRPHRISSALSEPGSTLLGSDNDNSRLMSGDEDDLDSRSETIYDSTRTGATGSSQSGARRPPIDTIFDESPPPELPSKNKLIDLHDLIHHDGSFPNTPETDNHIGAGQDVSTPARAAALCKEDDSPTPMHNPSEIFLSPEHPSPSPQTSLELKTHGQNTRISDPDQDEELWSFENAEISHAEAVYIRNVSLSGSNNPLTSSSPPHDGSPIRRTSPTALTGSERPSKSNIFEWSEQPNIERGSSQGSPRPKTVHGRQGKDGRGSHVNGRRGPSALHLRSQSVPVHKDMTNRRSHNNPSNLDSWILGHKGPSEDWDGDFDFEEAPRTSRKAPASNDPAHPNLSSGMLVPRTILERQASVHGQFGQVKELALLVEDLKRLQQQAAGQGIMEGQSAELWKEAEGIINLATLDDDDQEAPPPRSPRSPSFDFDCFDEDSPSIRSRGRSGTSPPQEEHSPSADESPHSQISSQQPHAFSGFETPPRPTSRPRKDSSAKAKSVLETIHQQRSHYDAALLDAPFAQKKLPFDTTSLKDLVTRAGVVTRALKEIVRRAENGPETPEPRSSSTPRDPPYLSQMFQHPPVSPTLSKSPRVSHSPKSPKSQRSGTFIGGSISANDNEINGHMKMMTVV